MVETDSLLRLVRLVRPEWAAKAQGRSRTKDFLITKMLGVITLAAVIELMPASTTHAAPNPVSCRAIRASAARLACYDKALEAQVAPDVLSGPSHVKDDEKVIAHWSGAGERTTRPFHADGPWELQWTTGEGFFAIKLYKVGAATDDYSLVANGMKAGSSSSFQPAGGDYYISFSASQEWSARAVAVAGVTIPPAKSSDPDASIPDFPGDQTNLPPCDGPDAAETLKSLIEESPSGQTNHIKVLHVGTITSRTLKNGTSICTAKVLTNGGDLAYDFRNYRRDNEIYTQGHVVSDGP